MEIEKLQKLADSFFEWPTEDRAQVTLTSALLFAQHVLRMAVQAGEPGGEPAAWLVHSRLHCTGMTKSKEEADFLLSEGIELTPLYTAPQAKPAPIPTSERLPTEADADANESVWLFNKMVSKWYLYHWRDVETAYISHWLPTGLTIPPAPTKSEQPD